MSMSSSMSSSMSMYSSIRLLASVLKTKPLWVPFNDKLNININTKLKSEREQINKFKLVKIKQDKYFDHLGSVWASVPLFPTRFCWV